jgi:hypothetical protein
MIWDVGCGRLKLLSPFTNPLPRLKAKQFPEGSGLLENHGQPAAF